MPCQSRLLLIVPMDTCWLLAARTTPCDCGTLSAVDQSPFCEAIRPMSMPFLSARTLLLCFPRQTTERCACGTRKTAQKYTNIAMLTNQLPLWHVLPMVGCWRSVIPMVRLFFCQRRETDRPTCF